MELDQKKDFEFRGKPPADAARVASLGSYDLLISGQRKCLYVYPTEYRVGTLQVSKQTLINLIQLLDTE
ncbi:hypothetical protein F9K33_14555 [bacterium]|nr:MAG: hypothetical protein F9K33_14555 [bacterium]